MTEIAIAKPNILLEDPHNGTDMDDALTALGAVCDALARREGLGFTSAPAPAPAPALD
jgi:hypothetical protein